MSSAAQEKQSLMTRLLDAVKQCQIRFGGKTELATEADCRVSCLCAAWEAVLCHGLKHTNKALSTLKQVSQMTGLTRISSAPGLGLLGDIKNIETEPVFWHCVREILSKHELQRYKMLKKITTDAGRGRAWLRSALNEHSLEKYMHMILDNHSIIRQHYEEWGFLHEQEKASMLPNMAAGLGSILFAIGIDREELNTIKPATGLDNFILPTNATNSGYPPRADIEPRPVIAADGSPQAERRKKKKKLKKNVKIVSFEEGDSSISASPGSSVASSVVTSPRTTTSGVDFSNISAILCNSRAHQGFLPRQGSADSQTSQGSLSYSRPVYLPKQSSSESSSSVSSRGILVGKHLTEGDNGSLSVLDSQSVQISSKNICEQDLVGSDEVQSKGIQREFVDKKSLEGTMGNVENLRDIQQDTDSNLGTSHSQPEVTVHPNCIGEDTGTVTPFSNPFEDTEIPIEMQKYTDTSNNKFDRSAVVSQGSTESASSSVPDIVDICLDTPLSVQKNCNLNQSSHNSLNDDSSTRKISFSIYDDPINPSLDKCAVSGGDQLVEDRVKDAEKCIQSGSARMRKELDKEMTVNEHSSNTPAKPVVLHKRTASLTSNTSNKSATSDSSHSVTSHQDIPSNLTPLGPDGTIQLPRRNASFSASEDGQSVDSSEVQHSGYNDMTYSAAVALAMAQKGLADQPNNLTTLRTQGDGSNAPDPFLVTPGSDTMTTVELKQAVIAMMLRKDEVEEQNKHLRAMFETEIEVSTALRSELEEAKKSHLAKQDRDAEKIKALSRENELLKHQLKKYVNAVQMLRRQGARPEDFPGLHMEEEPQPPIPPPVSSIDYSLEASEYEKKLIQVAEMHGELMEFNELLQKSLLAKDSLIRRYKDELVELRGPLPEDLHVPEDEISITCNPADYSLSSSLVHVWIPSAFLRGATSDAFHVYQIYIRIKDDEWNVYRRYSEFKFLNDQLKKKYPAINTFDFPKKKAIGNKDSKFVEDRRKKLQIYIRKVVNLLSHGDPDLAVNVCKQKLLESVPFFGDKIEPDKKGRGKGKNIARRGGGGGVGASTNSPVPGPSEEQYMGL